MAKKTQPKSGVHTSEFWLSTVAVVVGAIATSGLLVPATPVAVAVGLITSILGALGYTASRTKVKTYTETLPPSSE